MIRFQGKQGRTGLFRRPQSLLGYLSAGRDIRQARGRPGGLDMQKERGMAISTAIIKFTNKIFPKVVHPFNLQNQGTETYAQWQYRKGGDTIRFFLEARTAEEMFRGRQVLDMGCGAAGKSLYYCSLGAEKVTGVEIVAHYEQEANALAEELGFADRFQFVCASAFELPFPDNSFDTIIMNDFMEHVSDPARTLKEALRLIRPTGAIYINFPPYYHPTGAHLSDVINMPWVHLFFTENMLVKAYKELVKGLPDEKERLELRLSRDENGREYFGYINKMTLKKFKKILARLDIRPVYYREVPLRSWMAPLAKIPGIKEMFVKMGVCIIQKQ
jgi:ubiquinone/menaquinone biosynthesis C-methylase UbiE